MERFKNQQALFAFDSMEKRKVQMTGGSSYIITLPKEWIKRMNIRKNDLLNITAQPDGTLIISPDSGKEADRRQMDMDVTGGMDSDYLFRILVAAYIKGYSVINLHSRGVMEEGARSVARQFSQNSVGLEIVEEDEKFIEIRDLLSPSEMPFERTIRRMHLLVRAMHMDAIEGLVKEENTLLNDSVERDIEVDRLYWLVAHQYNSALRSTETMLKMGITQESGVYYFIVAKTMERIGDHAVRIARNAMKMEKRPSPAILKDIEAASRQALSLFSDSVDSWLKKDMKAANVTIEKTKKLAVRCEKLNNMVMKEKGMNAIALSYITESIRRTGEYSGDISEMAINYLVK